MHIQRAAAAGCVCVVWCVGRKKHERDPFTQKRTRTHTLTRARAPRRHVDDKRAHKVVHSHSVLHSQCVHIYNMNEYTWLGVAGVAAVPPRQVLFAIVRACARVRASVRACARVCVCVCVHAKLLQLAARKWMRPCACRHFTHKVSGEAVCRAEAAAADEGDLWVRARVCAFQCARCR